MVKQEIFLPSSSVGGKQKNVMIRPTAMSKNGQSTSFPPPEKPPSPPPFPRFLSTGFYKAYLRSSKETNLTILFVL
jgi:hypothetical protein